MPLPYFIYRASCHRRMSRKVLLYESSKIPPFRLHLPRPQPNLTLDIIIYRWLSRVNLKSGTHRSRKAHQSHFQILPNHQRPPACPMALCPLIEDTKLTHHGHHHQSFLFIKPQTTHIFMKLPSTLNPIYIPFLSTMHPVLHHPHSLLPCPPTV